MKEGTPHRIENPPSFVEIVIPVTKKRESLRAQGITPELILMGVDLYLLCQFRFRNEPLMPAADDVLIRERLYGLDIICDPFLEPMELRIIGSNRDNSLRASIVREANDKA